MKAIIIDDSRLARVDLKAELDCFDDVNIIGECGNAADARKMIEAKRPDVIFLDIQMPEMNGFELLEVLDYYPEVIFTTGYEEFAIKAFEYNALDYLLKPVRKERLEKALQTTRDRIALKENRNISDKLGPEDSIFVKDGDKCWFVMLKEIRIFEVSGNYVRLYFANNKPLVHRTLGQLEARLDQNVFFRVNRSQMINTSFIDRIEPWFSNTLKVYLKTGEEIEVSRRQSALFRDFMSI